MRPVKNKVLLLLLALVVALASCRVREIKIEPDEVHLGLGEIKQLTVVTVPGNVKKNVNSFTSSDISIVSVDAQGYVVGEGVGEAVISVAASKSKGAASALAKVIVSSVIKINADDTELTAVGKTLSFKFFESEESFLKKVYAFNKLELTGLDVNAFTIDSITYDENCVLGLTSSFVKGQPLPSDFFGEIKEVEGERGKTYNTKFSMTISAKGITIPVEWDDSKGDDSLTIPEAGSFVISGDNFIISDMDSSNFTAMLTLVNLKTVIKGAYDGNIESGDGTVTISVKSEGAVVGSANNVPISQAIEIPISGFSKRPNELTFDISFTLNSGRTPVWANSDVVKAFIFPAIKTIISKSIEINPLFVSIVRSSDERGAVTPQGSVLLNFGGEIESALKAQLGVEYRFFDWDSATWSGNIVNSADNSVVATITDAPYKKRALFDLGLDKEISVKLVDGKIVAASTTAEETDLVVSMAWGSEQMYGDSIRIPNRRDFPETIQINNGLISNSGTTYALVFGDDFNYHFNGLNYKTTNRYHAVKTRPDLDLEASRYDKYWGLEVQESQPFLRRSSAWDIRNTETKNGILLSKAIACDPATGTIYLGHGRSKAVDGFGDLLPGVDHITGRTRSKTVKYGYVEGKVRVRNKAYNNGYIRGPWYAFWLHGDMHEYDIMEFCNEGNGSREVNLCLHWHNGWATFGSNPGSSWIKYTAPADYENEWWTLGLYWDEEKVVWTYNGKEMARMSAIDNNSGVEFSIPNGSNAWGVSRADKRTLSGVATSYNRDTNPQIAGGTTPLPYTGGKLKGIMDVPMNIFAASTESSSSWGGPFAGADKLPTWMEVEYVAYYLPVAELQDIKITSTGSTTVKIGKELQLGHEVIPAQTQTREVEWISSDPSVATVSATGLVKTLSAGTVTITCRSKAVPSIYDELTLQVSNNFVMPTSIVITPSDATIGENDDFAFSAIVFPENASDKSIVWDSSDPSVASVDDDGRVSVWNHGTVTVTATSVANTSVVGTATLNVNIPPTGVTLNGQGSTTMEFEVASQSPRQLSATVAPAKTIQTVRWESSDENVATVTSGGLVTFMSIGTATISAISTLDETKRASVTYNLTAFQREAAPASISVGGNTFTLVKAFNFDNSNDVVLIENQSISGDRLTLNGLYNECKIQLNNIGKYDAMSIRYKYSGVSPNLDATFGTDVCHYTYYRPTANISVSEGAQWNPRQYNEPSFGADPDKYFVQHVVGFDGQIFMTKGNEVKSGSLTKQGEWTGSANLWFRDADSGNRGTCVIDYIAFYVGQESSINDDIVRDGNTYQVVKVFDFDNANGVTLSSGTITSNVAGGAIALNFPATAAADQTLDFAALPENADYLEMRVKVSPNNNSFAPHIGINTFENAILTNSRNGSAGGGYCFRVGPLHNVSGNAINIGDNQYIKLGYVLDGTKVHKFFRNGEAFSITSPEFNAPAAASSGYKLFLRHFKNGAGTVTIDYVIFYKKK